MRLRTWLSVALLAAMGAGAQQPSGFPHERHAKLFPDCLGCHAGVASGEAATIFPSTATCTNCHNDVDAPRVKWAGATPRITNLRFSHAQHAADIKAGPLAETCASCHTEGNRTGWMQVSRVTSSVCLGCHTATEHLADNAVCKTCHVKLTEATALPASRIAAFPKPPSHARADFAATHAPRTTAAIEQCATCHSRESCARCHPNAGKVGAISALGSDARVAQLVKGKAATYFTPASHRSESFAVDHGALAAQSAAGCANCHTQTTCKSCHTGSKGSEVVARLAEKGEGTATGVRLTKNVRVHPANFEQQHKSTASSGRLDCLGCHKQAECTSCHEGSGSRRYHPFDFSSRHAASAYGQDQNCSTCHRTETFCRSCHQKTNAATGIRTGAVHTAQPLWLLQHGKAARQGLTSCTSCHQQRDCLQCHSNLGWGVNPHGSGFDASRMAARNKAVCRTCHLTDPLAKSP